MNSQACARYVPTSTPRISFAQSIKAAVASMSSTRAGLRPIRLVKNLRTRSIGCFPVSDWIEVQTSGSLFNVLVAPAVASGDHAVALAQNGGDVGNLEAPGLAGVAGAAAPLRAVATHQPIRQLARLCLDGSIASEPECRKSGSRRVLP